MSKKKFKKGDLFEYDFGYGIVIEVQTQPDQQDEGNTTEFCKVLWTDGSIELMAMWRMNEPSTWLKPRLVARGNKESEENS